MATATTTGTSTYAGLTTEQRLFYEMNMLERAIPNFLHLFFGLQGSVHPVTTLPLNKGHQIQWNKLTALSAVTTALAEGITPEPEDITVTTATDTVSEYGAYIRFTKSQVEMGIHKISAEASDALGEQAGDSLDQITRAVLVADGTVQYANNRANTAALVSGDYLTFTECMEAVTTLRTAKAVSPLPAGFPILVHPNTVYDLFTDPVFQSIASYAHDRGKSNPWMEGHVGDAFGLCFYMTPNGYSESSTVTVYHSLVLGKGAFGVGGLAAYMPQIISEQQNKGEHTMEKVQPLQLIHQDFGSSGTADPFQRISTIAWFTTWVTQVLNSAFYVRIEHDCALD
jgi:N4-gp56 family major capsid protein